MSEMDIAAVQFGIHPGEKYGDDISRSAFISELLPFLETAHDLPEKPAYVDLLPERLGGG